MPPDWVYPYIISDLEALIAAGPGNAVMTDFADKLKALDLPVDRELAIIEGIERGLADVEAGRTVSHEDAMSSVRRAIEVAAGGSA
jgi:hypothetical protein